MFTVDKNDSAVNYPGGMTLDEFNADPGADQASGTMQTYKVENKSLLLSTLLSKNTHLDYTFHNLEKTRPIHQVVTHQTMFKQSTKLI